MASSSPCARHLSSLARPRTGQRRTRLPSLYNHIIILMTGRASHHHDVLDNIMTYFINVTSSIILKYDPFLFVGQKGQRRDPSARHATSIVCVCARASSKPERSSSERRYIPLHTVTYRYIPRRSPSARAPSSCAGSSPRGPSTSAVDRYAPYCSEAREIRMRRATSSACVRVWGNLTDERVRLERQPRASGDRVERPARVDDEELVVLARLGADGGRS